MWACRPDHVCTWPCHDDDSDWFAHLEVPCWPTVWKCLSLTSSSLVSQRPGFLYRSVWVPKWCSLLRTKIRIDPSFRLFRRNRLLQTLEESSRVWETIRPRKISDHSGYIYRRRWGLTGNGTMVPYRENLDVRKATFTRSLRCCQSSWNSNLNILLI